jgi:hypothetical protein
MSDESEAAQLIPRLLSEAPFDPDSIAILTMAFEAAALELKIPANDERGRLDLAKLVLQIGAGDSQIDSEDLTEKMTAAWEWRAKAPPPVRPLRK